MRDIEVINDLCNKLGTLAAVGEALSINGTALSAQHVHNWLRRGRVAPEQRFNFLTVYNDVMPKAKQLPLSWLAVPATDYNGGTGDGRKSYRTKEPVEKRERKKVRAKVEGKRQRKRARA